MAPPPTPTIDVGAGEAGLAERLPAVRGDLDGLGLLGVGHLDGDGLVALVRQVVAQRLAGLGQRLGVDHRDPLRPASDQAGQLAEQLPADQHLVRVGAGGAADLDRGSAAVGCASSAFGATPDVQAPARRSASATSSGVRPSVATTARATSV